jgi:hypothetical protein
MTVPSARRMPPLRALRIGLPGMDPRMWRAPGTEASTFLARL